ncbi:MAG: DUF4349 domain-containing protein [Gemmatimonadaceae bacterium]
MRRSQFTALTAASMLLFACSKESETPTIQTDAALASSVVQAKSTNGAGFVGGVVGRRDATAPAMDEVSAESAPSTPQPSSDPSTVQIAPTMVIHNGQASVEVDKIDPAIVKLRQLAVQLGGYIGNSSMSGGRDQVKSATLELKIPAQRFDQAINGLGTLGKVESVNSTAEDVGEEYVDVTARVNNAHRLEDRLIALLATRTGKLQDVLSVERELARVREEIERYEGRLRYLKSRVATSTLSVTVHEPLPILGQGPGQNPIVAAIRAAWRNFVGFISAGIASLGILIPLGVLALLGWIIYKRARKRTS